MAKLGDVILRGAIGDIPAAGTEGRLYVATDEDKLYRDNGTTWDEVVIGAVAEYPQQCMRFITEFVVAAGSPTVSVPTVSSSQPFCFYCTTSNEADGDALEVDVALAAGTYTMSVLGVKASSRGLLDWSLDGAAAFETGQDWYIATSAFAVIQTATVTVNEGGVHTLRATVNGKNASSSSYKISLTAVWFQPQ